LAGHVDCRIPRPVPAGARHRSAVCPARRQGTPSARWCAGLPRYGWGY
jgi:ATPase components of ABC transporters with duplicated ATPase domains